MKKTALILFAAVACIAAADIETRLQDVSPQQLQKQNKQIVMLAAKELSKNLPKKIDKYTTCVKIEAKDSSLIYTFELDVPQKSDEEIRKKDRTRMEEAIKKGICLSSKRFMDAEITVLYRYISHKTKKTLFEFPVSKKDCQKIYRRM